MRLIKDSRPQFLFRSTTSSSQFGFPKMCDSQPEERLSHPDFASERDELQAYPDFPSDLDELHTILFLLSEYSPIQLDTELFALEAIAEAYFRRAYELLI